MGANEHKADASTSRGETAPADSKRGTSGDFTRMFQIPVPPSSADKQADAAGASREAGIFDDILPEAPPPLRAAEPPAKTQAAAAPGTSSRPVPAEVTGEFTRFFESPVRATPPPPSAAPAARVEPGDETGKWLRSLEMEAPPPAHNTTAVLSPVPPAAPVPDSMPAGPSQFTIVTAGRARPPAAAPTPTEAPPTPPTPPTAAAPVLAYPAAPVVTAPPVTAVPPSFPVPAVQPAPMPMMAPLPQVPAGPVPTAASGADRKEKKKVSYWPLIIIFNVLFLLAVLLVLYFALRH